MLASPDDIFENNLPRGLTRGQKCESCGGLYQNAQHLLTRDDKPAGSQTVPGGGGFLTCHFDPAIWMETRKRVKLRNGCRQKGDSEVELETPDTHVSW